VSRREDLEAALHEHPDDDATRAVYADLLHAHDDPRGELIALDLHAPSMTKHSLESWRGLLIRQWLGDDFDVQFDAEQQLWYVGSLGASHAKFDGGFLELFITEEDYTADLVVPTLLDTPAAEHLRSLSMLGSTIMLQQVLEKLVATKRPWLQHLEIARYPHLRPLLVDPALGAALVANAPHLEALRLFGRNLFGEWSHPTMHSLGVTGAEAIELTAGPPMFAVTTLSYDLEDDRPIPRGLVSPIRFPVLRTLDFSEAEPNHEALFPILETLAVASQITRLVLPEIRDSDRARLKAATACMPNLTELVINPSR